MSDAMIDIESMGILPNSVILTIGAMIFDPHSSLIIDELHLKIDTVEQLSINRSIDANTIEWWEKQDVAIRETAFGGTDRLSINEALTKLSEFINSVEQIWAQGPQFDIVALESLYRSAGIKIPWKYSMVRDSRTLFSVIGDKRPKDRPNAHNALEDCRYQVEAVQSCFSKLKNLSWQNQVDRQGGAFSDQEIISRNTWI